MNLAIIFGASMVLAGTSSRPPEPIGNPGEWIRTEDYPSAALRQEIQGTTGIKLDIDATGHVERCSVQSSSGSPLLDDTTCLLITRRGSYRPALDEQGRPASSTITERVRWQLPADTGTLLDFKPYDLVVSFEISQIGTVENCSFVLDPSNIGVGDPCAANAGRRFNPVIGKEGEPIRQRRYGTA